MICLSLLIHELSLVSTFILWEAYNTLHHQHKDCRGTTTMSIENLWNNCTKYEYYYWDNIIFAMYFNIFFLYSYRSRFSCSRSTFVVRFFLTKIVFAQWFSLIWDFSKVALHFLVFRQLVFQLNSIASPTLGWSNETTQETPTHYMGAMHIAKLSYQPQAMTFWCCKDLRKK